MTKNPVQRTGLIIFSLFLAFAVTLVVLIAIERDVIWPLIVGFVIVAVAIITAAAAMVNKVAVPFMDARLKYVDARLAHERSMLELKLRYSPALPAARANPAERTWKPELETWRWTGVEYVALTIDKLGRESTKLISANKAQEDEAWKSAGRVQHALDFLCGNGLAYVVTKGDRQEGTVISDKMTAGELMAILSPARLRGSK